MLILMSPLLACIFGIFGIFRVCISLVSCLYLTVSPWYLAACCISVSSHFATDPLYPAVSHYHCILYPAVAVRI